MDQSVGMLAGRSMLAEIWLPASAPLNMVVQPGETLRGRCDTSDRGVADR